MPHHGHIQRPEAPPPSFWPRDMPLHGHIQRPEPLGGDGTVVETNSETFHTTPTDQAADEIRYHRLTLAGFTVGIVWEQDLWSNPRGAVDTIRTARRHAAAGRGVVVHSPRGPWVTTYLGTSRAA